MCGKKKKTSSTTGAADDGVDGKVDKKKTTLNGTIFNCKKNTLEAFFFFSSLLGGNNAIHKFKETQKKCFCWL
jgi:hypothetical protein